MGDRLSKAFGKMSSSGSKDANQVVISASGKHTATLIFLHGLGDTGHGWASTLAEIRPSNVKIVCPTAPTMSVTLNSGFQMPAWFDLLSLDPNGSEDEAGIKKSFGRISSIIDSEIAAGISPKNICLGGFSQGGALALYTGLRLREKKLGCIVALSCWLPLHKEFVQSGAAQNTAEHLKVPILQCHGDCDPVVPYKWGQLTSTLLKRIAAEHEFKTYRGLGHSSAEEELADIRNFIERFTNNNASAATVAN